MMNHFYALGLLGLILCGCGGDSKSKEELDWCESRSIVDIKAQQGSKPNSYQCSTVEGTLIFRKDPALCRAGAYYLADSTDTIFVCDPNRVTALPDSGIVKCPSSVKAFKQDVEAEYKVKAQGNFYPAKILCQSNACWCQNGLEVNQIDEP